MLPPSRRRDGEGYRARIQVHHDLFENPVTLKLLYDIFLDTVRRSKAVFLQLGLFWGQCEMHGACFPS
jgi:hypothetical protein